MARPLFKCVVSVVLVVFLFSLFGCATTNSVDESPVSSPTESGKITNTQSSEPTTPSDSQNKDRDKNYLTSIEAAELAYEEAKQWSEDAVLKRITIGTRLGLHYDWANTDLSYSWTVDFVSPSKGQMLYVYVNFGGIDSTTISSDNLKNLPIEGHPKDKPLISLKEANAILLENGSVYGIMPINVEYSAYGYSNKGFPSWFILYEVPTPDGGVERYLYYVNAQTGEVTDVVYRNNDNDDIEKSELQVKGPDLSSVGWKIEQRHLIIKFLTLINEGKTNEALLLMDDSMLPNDTMKQMWTDSLSSIAGHSFISGGFVTEDEENWTEEMQRFEVEINIPDSCNCEQYGWDHGNVTRWIAINKIANTWKIHEIATSP